MTVRDRYTPGPADAKIASREGENWTLVLTRELRHSPESVWAALTEPEQLREWAPFDVNRNLGSAGPAVFTTVGAPGAHVSETEVLRAEAPSILEYRWGGGDVRWQLEPMEGGTRLTLWASINNRYIAMGAAGWHLSIDVLDHLLSGEPMGRIAGMEAMQFPGWQRLNAEYSAQFGIEAPSW